MPKSISSDNCVLIGIFCFSVGFLIGKNIHRLYVNRYYYPYNKNWFGF